MAEASYVQTSFLGGEVSKTAQGRTDDPAYRTWMNVCFNSLPFEQGAWTRRPGTMHAGPTRAGVAGRVINFDFKLSTPYSMEFTAGYLRFRNGPTLVTTNDQQAVLSISAANPAKVKTVAAHGWVSGNQVSFNGFGANNPLLQGRLFVATVTSATEFTLTDAITGATIDGATLGAFVSGNVARVMEIATPYIGTLWSSLRAIQADIPVFNSSLSVPGAVLLQGTIKPYVLTVVDPPTATTAATFTLAPVLFRDGPYFDPFTNGVQATPSAKNGIISLTLSFATWDAARAYALGDYVTSAAVNYRSLVDANLASAPPSANWVAVSANEAIGPNGFQGTDIGRHVRLFSEPPIWSVATAYTIGQFVTYNPSGLPGANTYWRALTNNTGNIPGVDVTNWTLVTQNAALWSWGKIVSLLNEIDRSLAGSSNLGDMTSGGGLAAAFDGVPVKSAAVCAEQFFTWFPGRNAGGCFVGKVYVVPGGRTISSAVVTPSSDLGYVTGTDFTWSGVPGTLPVSLNLRASLLAPANSGDGVLLGGLTISSQIPYTITSNDLTTVWNYVWLEMSLDLSALSFWTSLRAMVSQVQFFAANNTSTGNGINVQIYGPALLYTSPVRTWRLGLFSDTTGWPACGTYHEGRLFLSGLISNRWDASKSNDPFNFEPTNPDGSVSGNNAISYTFNAPDLSPIFWMQPEDPGVVCGTQGGEWLIQATNANLPLTPTTVQAHRVTKYNCANIEPKRTNLTIAVVQTFRRELLEFFPDVISGKFSAHDLVVLSKHVVSTGIAEIAWQQELIPTLWGRCDNGSLFGVTYGRSSLQSQARPDFAAMHRHTLGSNRTVESLTVAGNSDGTLDALTMVTNDDSLIRHVEMLANYFTESDTLPNAWLLDNAVRPSSTPSSSTPTVGAPYGGMTLNGLWHLNGKTVSVFCAGLDCGQGEIGTSPVDFLVTNGSLFVPYGDGISAGSGSGLFTETFATAAATAGQIVVGFTYNSDGQIVRPNSPPESGARTGPAFAKLRRSTYCGLLVNQTAGLSIGTTFAKLQPVLFKGSDQEIMGPGQTYSGIYRDTVTDDDSFDGMICWRVSRPLPVTIAAIGAFLQTKDP